MSKTQFTINNKTKLFVLGSCGRTGYIKCLTKVLTGNMLNNDATTSTSIPPTTLQSIAMVSNANNIYSISSSGNTSYPEYIYLAKFSQAENAYCIPGGWTLQLISSDNSIYQFAFLLNTNQAYIGCNNSCTSCSSPYGIPLLSSTDITTLETTDNNATYYSINAGTYTATIFNGDSEQMGSSYTITFGEFDSNYPTSQSISFSSVN